MSESQCSDSTLFPQEPEIPQVRLRAAAAADAAMLAVTGTATFLGAYTWALPGADIVDFCLRHHTTAAYAAYLAKPDTRITLAVTGADAPVGYAMVCAPDIEGFAIEPGDLELKRIYLLSRYQGLGAGGRLLRAAFADALALGAKRLLLGTHEGNVKAIAFYRRHGFELVGSRTFQVGAQSCCDLVMARALTP